MTAGNKSAVFAGYSSMRNKGCVVTIIQPKSQCNFVPGVSPLAFPSELTIIINSLFALN